MKKNPEPMKIQTYNLTDSQVAKVKALSLILKCNASEVIRLAVDTLAKMHEYDLQKDKQNA